MASVLLTAPALAVALASPSFTLAGTIAPALAVAAAKTSTT